MDDNSTIPFGKYKGMRLADIPQGWFIWMYDHKKLTGELKRYAEENIEVLKIQKRQQASMKNLAADSNERTDS